MYAIKLSILDDNIISSTVYLISSSLYVFEVQNNMLNNLFNNCLFCN